MRDLRNLRLWQKQSMGGADRRERVEDLQFYLLGISHWAPGT